MERKTVRDGAGRWTTSFEGHPLEWMREFSGGAPKDNLSMPARKEPSNILKKVIDPIKSKIKLGITQKKVKFLSKIGVYPPLTENVKFYIEYPKKVVKEVEFVGSSRYFGFVSPTALGWKPYNISGHTGWTAGCPCNHKISQLFFVVSRFFYLKTPPKEALKEASSILSSLKGKK